MNKQNQADRHNKVQQSPVSYDREQLFETA
jgi:hypothetical protein